MLISSIHKKQQKNNHKTLSLHNTKPYKTMNSQIEQLYMRCIVYAITSAHKETLYYIIEQHDGNFYQSRSRAKKN